jgi:hypothetical protein
VRERNRETAQKQAGSDGGFIVAAAASQRDGTRGGAWWAVLSHAWTQHKSIANQ